MTTGWKWIDSKGNEYKSIMAAAHAYQEDPTLTFEFSELSMSGSRVTNGTPTVSEFAARILKEEQ